MGRTSLGRVEKRDRGIGVAYVVTGEVVDVRLRQHGVV